MAYEGYPTGNRERVVASAARTAAGNSGALPSDYSGAKTIRAQLNVTAISGASANLAVLIEDSVDDGVTWNTVGTFAAKTAVGREVINITNPFGPKLRVSWTLTGTTPSATFAVDWFTES